MKKVCIVTGCTGQVGSYLVELLLSEGWEVHGIVRRSSNLNTQRIDHLYKDPHEDTNLFLHFGDMTDGISLSNLIHNIKPEIIFNMAAQSHVKVSFENPIYTENVVATGVLRLLEIIRGLDYTCKLYQASTSELFGNSPPPQNELTPMIPNSPYAVAKYAAFLNVVNYRNGYGIFASNGILFNTESPRRGETFVTRKITKGVANIKLGKQEKLYLGNLGAKRDWMYAGEAVESVYRIMMLGKPDDIVIGTGETHTVQEFVEEAFSYVGLDWKKYVEIDERYLRPTEVNVLQADTRKAQKLIGWNPKVKFKELVKIMVDADLKECKR